MDDEQRFISLHRTSLYSSYSIRRSQADKLPDDQRIFSGEFFR
jgi:hypothetical protein